MVHFYHEITPEELHEIFLNHLHEINFCSTMLHGGKEMKKQDLWVV